MLELPDYLGSRVPGFSVFITDNLTQVFQPSPVIEELRGHVLFLEVRCDGSNRLAPTPFIYPLFIVDVYGKEVGYTLSINSYPCDAACLCDGDSLVSVEIIERWCNDQFQICLNVCICNRIGLMEEFPYPLRSFQVPTLTQM
jgi:hypothetical protein